MGKCQPHRPMCSCGPVYTPISPSLLPNTFNITNIYEGLNPGGNITITRTQTTKTWSIKNNHYTFRYMICNKLWTLCTNNFPFNYDLLLGKGSKEIWKIIFLPQCVLHPFLIISFLQSNHTKTPLCYPNIDSNNFVMQGT